ncbi:MAG: hypothetical protein AseanaTS_27450 [Candidatus Pelagadaptatus aseana]|uniref:DUF6868 family protein n=1 Tax=Candidatus Pelagadaptatus aseana TaxID=3120508 RepID=UPI0039B19C8F
MLELPTVTAFFGWCLVFNTAFLVFSSLFLYWFRDWAIEIHSKLCGVEKDQLNVLYFNYLGHFKIVTITLSLVPYLALKMIA